jgi:hypothetical protein
MQDIRRVFADYMEYVNYLIDAMNNMYEYFNAMPLIAYTKHVMNTVSEKVRIYGFSLLVTMNRESKGSSVSIVTSLWAGQPGFSTHQVQ